MAVPKLFLQDLKKRTKTKKSRKTKIFVFWDSKGQSACSNDDLRPKLYGIYFLYQTKGNFMNYKWCKL